MKSDSQVDVMFHESHARVARPTLLVVVSDDIFIVRVGMFRQVSLDQVSRLLCREPGNMSWTVTNKSQT